MDHDETLEMLEVAAVEPGGLDRLIAGDTAQAARIAGHLAGCDACATEMERLRRAAPLLRDLIRTTPPADLRERTLAVVRQRGVQRGVQRGIPGDHPGRGGPETRRLGPDTRGSVRLPWVVGIAAAMLVAVVAGSALVGGSQDGSASAQDRVIAALEGVASSTVALTADPEHRRVSLVSGGRGTATGTLLFSPRTGDMVVVATGLAALSGGDEYRCWVMVDGERLSVGRMYVAQDLAYWVGMAEVMMELPPDVSFGVSLVPAGADEPDDDPLLLGQV